MIQSSNTRTYVVTGAASGIGKAAKSALEAAGHRVIGVDLANSDVSADLASAEGRSSLRRSIQQLGVSGLDGVLAIAGVSNETSVPVRVNYFGAIATLEALRPLLSSSAAPRAVVVSSFAAIAECDSELLEALRSSNEEAAVTRADALAASGSGRLIYASTKRAIAEWIRQSSIAGEWAGAGIPLNAVAPGVIITPLTEPILGTAEQRDEIMKMVPMPLNGPAQPEVIADALVWLTSAQNTHVTGQVLFVDGGAEATVRGPRIFDERV